MHDATVLRYGEWQATVSSVGAELRSLRHARLGELLWQGDPVWWAGRSPILFPVVGRSTDDRVIIEGRSFRMPLHGFARESIFDRVRAEERSCTLSLVDDQTTSFNYPFAFRLDLTYRLGDQGLEAEATVTNRGAEPMPFSFGFHPGFRWPLHGDARPSHWMEFPNRTRLSVRRASDGYMRQGAQSLELENGRLALSDDLFEAGAMVMDAMPADGGLHYGGGDGPPLRIGWRNLPQLVLWTRPGAPFVCVEPWAGQPDPQGFTGDIWARPGIRRLAPAASERFGLAVGLAA